ncbi:MAG TPA: HAMP domain-containing sensor histidine kinase [Candidatus Peribacteraceae bacterium]|nr:HAMP domain-containing sensor histidine kinase [Candidatus Peribacteraceae bacterium]
MSNFNKKNKVAKKAGLPSDDKPQTIMANLYKKNIDLSDRNKTLSLLSKIYEIGILAIKPEELASRISREVQLNLNFEIVSIYKFEEASDSLIPLSFSISNRVSQSLKNHELLIAKTIISTISKEPALNEVVHLKKQNISIGVKNIWGVLLDSKKIEKFSKDSNIKNTFLYPLVVENRTLGMILISLNRNYKSLSSFEKESIKNIMNVTALALEKSYLYVELENANDQLREQDRQKDELLSMVSHQLATPVSAVRWNLEMMLDGDTGKLNKEQEDSLKSLQSISADLSDLVSMILDVSRIQLGRIKMDPQELDLDQFFKEILNVIIPKAKEKNVNFNISLPKQLPKAMLDKRYTRMTIENLLSNAVKYTSKEGDVDFTVTIQNDSMHCEVKDTGVGIPKADQDKIFGKQFRASNVRNAVDGNGFGLYIAKSAVESQGGKIWFDSKEGKGTTFFVTLPLGTRKKAIK